MGTYNKGYSKNFRIVYTVEMEPAPYAPHFARPGGFTAQLNAKRTVDRTV